MGAPEELVGRETELAALRDGLQRSRLVTVWGPAGVGKSRLVRAALSDRAVLCSLVAASDADGVLRAVARGLGAAPSSTPLLATVTRAVGRAKGPLVLDGADGVGTALGELLTRWLASSDGTRFVVTAQGPLGTDGELPLELEPLSSSDAIAVWMSATRRLGHEADPALARSIVDRLDRLPLALEWYASRASLLGDAACLEQLQLGRDPSPLSAALTPSLEALAQEEQAALSVICSFEEGASAVVLERLSGVDLEVLDRLARRALVRTTRIGTAPPRVTPYRAVVECVREQAREQGCWEELARAHARAVLDIAASADLRSGLAEAADDPGHRTLIAERSELEAITRRFEQGDPELALQALLAWCPLALQDGTAERAASTLARIVAQLPAPDRRTSFAQAALARRLGRIEEARAHLAAAQAGGQRFEVLIELAHLDRMQSRSEQALVGYQAALQLAVGLEDPVLQSIAKGEVGRMLQSLGRFREAQALHEQAIALQRSLGLGHREALERSLHARATHRAGDVAEAIPLHQQALAQHEQHHQLRRGAAELGHLGFCFHELGDGEQAEAHFRRSVDGLADVGDVVLECIERTLLARLLADLGRPAEAKLELAIVETTTRAVDMPRVELTRRFVAGLVEIGLGRLESAWDHFSAALELGLHLEVGFEALLPAHLALVERALGETARIAERLDQSEAVIGELATPGLRAALGVLAAAVRGSPIPEVPVEVSASSSDTRRALRLVEQVGLAAALRIAGDGRRLELPDGTAHDLSRRAAPRRLLLALAAARVKRPGVVLDHDELIAAGWPGERMGVEAARKRLRTAIWTLRKMGLEPTLLTRDDGYLLDPLVPLDWSEPPAER